MALLRAEFPQAFIVGSGLSIEEAWHGGCRVRQPSTSDIAAAGRHDFRADHDGAGAISPMYVAILASIGPVPLAVTTNLNINFLRKPAQARPDRRRAG